MDAKKDGQFKQTGKRWRCCTLSEICELLSKHKDIRLTCSRNFAAALLLQLKITNLKTFLSCQYPTFLTSEIQSFFTNLQITNCNIYFTVNI